MPLDPEEKLPPGEGFSRLVEIMARLRAPGGCPWDREQTFDSIKPYTLEETYEVLDAVDARDWAGLAEELGDFILQAVFYAQMAADAGHFDIRDSLQAINSKLVRRHPHVFGDANAQTADDVKRKWDEIKATEKPKPSGTLAGISTAQPALMEARQISSKAAGAGFDWPSIDGVFAKLREELTELDEARAGASLNKNQQEEIEGEIGDLLFVVVNLARFLKVDPEQALRRTNAKFRRRFAQMEAGLQAQGKSLKDSTLDEMESQWQAAKRTERSETA